MLKKIGRKLVNAGKRDFWFLLALVVVCGFYYAGLIGQGPTNMHMWRQCDSISLTQNFAAGAGFFEPQMHVHLADNLESGRSAGELPILYYFVGKLSSVFGFSYLLFRLVYLGILLAGLYAFYLAGNLLLGNRFWAGVIALTFFTSPALSFYGISFLTDAPALFISIIGLYFMVRYSFDRKGVNVILSCLFLALAGLLKVSALIGFVFLSGIFVLEVLLGLKTLGKRKLFNGNKHEWIGFLGVPFLVVSWYYYAHLYNEAHGFKYTFNSIWPIWDLQKEQIEPFVKELKNITVSLFYSKAILLGLLFVGIFNLFQYKKINLFVFLTGIIIFLGALTYGVLWGFSLANHDYYFVAFLIVFPATLFPLFSILKQKGYLQHFNAKLFAVIFFVFNFIYCSQFMTLRSGAQKGQFYSVGNHGVVEYLRWFNWDSEQRYGRLRRVSEKLDSLGIAKTDKVLSFPDASLNVSLVLLGREGWTYYGFENVAGIGAMKEKGAKYLILNRKDFFEKEEFKPFMDNLIYEEEHLRIYKL